MDGDQQPASPHYRYVVVRHIQCRSISRQPGQCKLFFQPIDIRIAKNQTLAKTRDQVNILWLGDASKTDVLQVGPQPLEQRERIPPDAGS